ncbi:unnamed protein product [Sympodiomycopsis kandeliae]
MSIGGLKPFTLHIAPPRLPAITSADQRLAVGHASGNASTSTESYMSKRTTIDLQGLLMNGHEDHDAIASLPTDFEVVLTKATAADRAEVESIPLIKRCFEDKDRTKMEYDNAKLDGAAESTCELRFTCSSIQTGQMWEQVGGK